MIPRTLALPAAVLLTWCLASSSAATAAADEPAANPGGAAAGRAISVIVVGDADYSLTYAFKAMVPQVTTRFVALSDFRPDQKADLLVFVGSVPERAPEGVPALYVDTLPPGGGVTQAAGADGKPAVVGETTVLVQASDHPALRGINARNCTFTNVRKLQAAQGWSTLLGNQDAALVLANDAGKTRQMVIAFRPEDSSWPLKPSYAIFMFNAVLHLSGR